MIARTPAGDNDTKTAVFVSSSARHDDANSGKGWFGDVRERGERGARDKRGERGEGSEESKRVSISTLSSQPHFDKHIEFGTQFAYRNTVASSRCLSKRGCERNVLIEMRLLSSLSSPLSPLLSLAPLSPLSLSDNTHPPNPQTVFR